jgi:hypothetical protein
MRAVAVAACVQPAEALAAGGGFLVCGGVL